MKLEKYRKFLITIGLAMLLASFGGCTFYSEIEKPTGLYINLGNARGLGPSVITSVDLDISGPDMDTISKTYTYNDLETSNWIISIDVPPGDNRIFEITAHVNNESVITGYYGNAEQTVSGDTAEVDIHLGISGQKILTANPFNFAGSTSGNPSIVVMDDMEGNGWKRIEETDVSGWATETSNAYFQPWDMDVDESGNIIVVNNDSSGGTLWRFSSLVTPVFEPIITPFELGLVAVAVDRVNKLIYYADSYTLYRCDYSGLNIVNYTTNLSNIRGLAVDGSGMLYIANGSQVTKYDPSGTRSQLASYPITGSTVEDVMVKKNGEVYEVYVADSGNKQIVKLDSGLTNVVVTYTGPTGGLYGPRRFVATLNDGIYFIDEPDPQQQNPQEYNRLVYIDDISGNGYKEFGHTGYDTGEFSFYHGPMSFQQ